MERTWKKYLHEVIFEADTPTGKAFDVALLIAILVSVVTTCLETVDTLSEKYRTIFLAIDWAITILFTIEYVLRILCLQRPTSYIFSFFGIVDLLAIVPTFFGLALDSSRAKPLAVIRSLRLLRVFRVFKLGWFVSEAKGLSRAVLQSWAKIVVFLFTVMILVTIAGMIMYLLEGGNNPKLTSIPDGIYWAIVTMTTVGYGDIVPITPAGKIVSAILILFGYSLIIVPTGFVSAELVNSPHLKVSTKSCQNCSAEDHATDAAYCRMCGHQL